jgi:hypothetical protein
LGGEYTALEIDFAGPHERALIKIENAIVKKILSNVPPPNAESTIKAKKSSKTLIDSGEMVGHVTHRQTIVEGDIVGEVGIFNEAIAKRAHYLEEGVVWGHRPNPRNDSENREEEETREWFIPPRPFLKPAFDEAAPKAAEEMADEIWQQIEKQLGW